jgi:SAM-dependent methyltransferase
MPPVRSAGADGSSPAEFDAFAASYDAALDSGLVVTGEGKTYFAQGRAEWLARCLSALDVPRADVILDFGCGTGSGVPFLRAALGAREVVGVDISASSIEQARTRMGSTSQRFFTVCEARLEARADVAFCNGVFHHIPVAERAAAVAYVHRALRPGGIFAFWENNPWNPGTRWVMSRIPFDRDAVTLSAPEAKRLLQAGGFEVLRTDYLFVFPHSLSLLRVLEPLLSRAPLGGQYQVLCRKPKS